MSGARLSRRVRLFLCGVGASLGFVGVFFLGAYFQLTLTGGGTGRFNIVYRVLTWLFAAANPVFSLVGWASLRLPSQFAMSREGQIVVSISYVASFLGGWWLMATVIDRILARRSRSTG